MKYLYILLFFLFSTVFHAQVVNIPDSNFKNALIDEGVDTNNDGEIQVSEAQAVINLNVNGRDIQSLEGIGSFVNIEELYCSSNQLSSLDMSLNINLQKLSCIFNQLNNLNVTQNLNLKFLWCQDNLLSELDVSQNLNLEKLKCSFNPLDNIDITQNPSLLTLDCGNNQLATLDVSQNTNLERLSFDDNLISSIDISQNLNLQILTCSDNLLSQLDLSQHEALEYLECADNQLIGLFIDNGNNQNLSTMISTGNINLACIQVDDENAIRPECQGFPLVGWCKDGWTSYSEDCSLGVADVEILNINLYPNPTNNRISLDAPYQIDAVQIYDLMGRKVIDVTPLAEKSEMDLSHLTLGIYMAVISFEGKQLVKKIVKE